MFNVPNGQHGTGRSSGAAEDWDWRYGAGLLLFSLAGLSVVAGVVAVFGGHARHDEPGWPIWLLAGASEILCLAAAAILGKEKYQKLSRKMRRKSRAPDPTNRTRRFRYYLGLAGCLFNGVPITLYAYVPELMPEGTSKLSILVVADLVFFGSLFFAGGEFWEKLRRLFVWEGK